MTAETLARRKYAGRSGGHTEERTAWAAAWSTWTKVDA